MIKNRSHKNEQQGYEPDLARIFLRKIARLILQIFGIKGKTLWGNIVIQQFSSVINIRNTIDQTNILKIHTGHERLYWRAKTTTNLDDLYYRFISGANEKSVIYDIGANIGILSLLSSQALNCRVVAFEPEPMNFANLHQNVFENKLQDRVFCLPISLSDSNSVRTFYFKSISPGDAMHSIDQPSPQIDDSNISKVLSQKVASFSLDSLIDIIDLPKPTHIKIDVDGAETSILKGMKNLINATNHLSVFIETDISPNGNYKEISLFMMENKFTEVEISEPENNYSHTIRNALFIKNNG